MVMSLAMAGTCTPPRTCPRRETVRSVIVLALVFQSCAARSTLVSGREPFVKLRFGMKVDEGIHVGDDLVTPSRCLSTIAAAGTGTGVVRQPLVLVRDVLRSASRTVLNVSGNRMYVDEVRLLLPANWPRDNLPGRLLCGTQGEYGSYPAAVVPSNEQADSCGEEISSHRCGSQQMNIPLSLFTNCNTSCPDPGQRLSAGLLNLRWQPSSGEDLATTNVSKSAHLEPVLQTNVNSSQCSGPSRTNPQQEAGTDQEAEISTDHISNTVSVHPDFQRHLEQVRTQPRRRQPPKTKVRFVTQCHGRSTVFLVAHTCAPGEPCPFLKQVSSALEGFINRSSPAESIAIITYGAQRPRPKQANAVLMDDRGRALLLKRVRNLYQGRANTADAPNLASAVRLAHQLKSGTYAEQIIVVMSPSAHDNIPGSAIFLGPPHPATADLPASATADLPASDRPSNNQTLHTRLQKFFQHKPRSVYEGVLDAAGRRLTGRFTLGNEAIMAVPTESVSRWCLRVAVMDPALSALHDQQSSAFHDQQSSAFYDFTLSVEAGRSGEVQFRHRPNDLVVGFQITHARHQHLHAFRFNVSASLSPHRAKAILPFTISAWPWQGDAGTFCMA